MQKKIIISEIALLLILCTGLLSADEVSEYRKKQDQEIAAFQKNQSQGIKTQQQDFNQYLEHSRMEYNNWNKQRKKEFLAYKKEIEKIWGDFTAPTNKRWVEYSRDRQSVCAVDFEKGEATVSILVDESSTKKQISEEITKAVSRTLTSRGSDKAKPEEADKTEQRLPEPILSEQVADRQGLIVTVDRVSAFAEGLLEEAVITPVHTDASPNKPKKRKIAVSFQLGPGHLQKRIRRFMPYIEKYTGKYGINKARVLATIHTESHFNPMALSGANAVGLMQLVPIYGAREAYQFVYGTDAIPRQEYLYDPERNIELGCAYIYLLKNRYFSSVKNTDSQQFCTIAGYNTGPKNVARAFAGEKNVKNAVPIINRMKDAQQVYDHLVVHLPYSETRHYLAEVTERMRLYKK